MDVEDHEIVTLYWGRDPRALLESQRQYGGYCYRIAWNVLENQEDSDECVNDTWLRAWNAMPPQRPSRLSLFLGRITRNLALDRWREKRAERRGGGRVSLALEELSECVTKGDSTSEQVEAHQLTEAIGHFLETLPREDRQLFLGRYWYCRTIGELGIVFSLKENAVKTRLFRIRGKLREFLEKEGIAV